MSTEKVYELVTNNVLEMLDKGVVPWRKSWKADGILSATNQPRNATNGRRYAGINVFLLAITAMEKGWTDLRFATYKQIQAAGGQVKKGERGSLVTFWNMIARHGEGCRTAKAKKNFVTDRCSDQCRKIGFLKYFVVFNMEQQEGASFPEKFEPVKVEGEENPVTTIDAAEVTLQNYLEREKLTLKFGGDRAFYSPSEDFIQLPERKSFDGAEEFYATAFHESAHSTGHDSRLDRFSKQKKSEAAFGGHDYGIEELTAEFAAAFTSNVIGIDNTTENSAAYIDAWRKTIKADVKLVVRAAAAAQKAADYILNEKEVN